MFQQPDEPGLVQDRYPELGRGVGLAAGAGPDHDEAGLLRDTARGLAAPGQDRLLGAVAGETVLADLDSIEPERSGRSS